jgi:hypothetical protein
MDRAETSEQYSRLLFLGLEAVGGWGWGYTDQLGVLDLLPHAPASQNRSYLV